MSDNLRTDLQIVPRRTDHAWECNLCGAKFDSERNKDFHMTRCTASEADAAERSPDDMVRVANRFPANPHWEVPPYPANPANPALLGGPSDFSAPVGPKRDLTQPQPPTPQAATQTQSSPDFIMRRPIQYPPNSADPNKPPVTSRTIAPYLADGPPNPLFQNNNIQNISYRPEFKPNLPLQQAPRPHYAPRGTQPHLAFRAPPPSALLPSHIQTTPQTFRMSPSDPTTNAIHTKQVPSAPPVQQRAIYNEPSTSKLYSTRANGDASVRPRARRADGKVEVKLVWQKQQPTLETELQYFDEKEEVVLFCWDRRKEVFLAQTRLSPGEHSGNLLIPDTDKFLSVKPFIVSPHSVGVQEIKVDLVDIAVSANPTQQPSKTSSVTQGLDTAPTHEGRKPEHQVLHSQHRPLFQPVHAPGEKRDTQREKSKTFLVNPPLEMAMEREVSHTSPYRSLPPSFEIEEEPLPFQNNTPREKTWKEKDRIVPVVQLAYPQKEEQVAAADNPPFHRLPMNRLKQQTVNGVNEPSRKLEGEAIVSERERKLEGELTEWNQRFRKMEASNRTAENENNILKREVDQLKTRYIDTLSKQENRKKEVEELRLSLVQAKEEMDNLRGETDIKLQQSEQLEGERKRRHSEEKKLAYGEKENYKRAAYRYREEREKVKSSLEEMTRAYGEYKQRYADAQNSFSQLQQQLKQEEGNCEQLKRQNEILGTELSYLKKIQKQNSNEIKAGDETARYNLNAAFQPVVIPYEDREPSFDSILEKSNQEKKYRKVSYTRTPDSVASVTSLNPYSSLPHSYSSINSQASPTTDAALQPFKKKSVLNQVHLFEQEESKALGDSNPTTPMITPRVFKVPSNSKVQGVERYNPDVLTAFLNKSTSLSYKSTSVKAINLSYLMKPDSHRQKQVIVKIKDQYRLGHLQVVFSFKHPYLGRTGMVAGVKLQEAVGTSNGAYEAVQYFDCAPNHAIFASISEVFVPVI